MGIDLELPSKEHRKEDRISNANKARDRSKKVAERQIVAENDKDRGPTVSGRVFDSTHKVYTGSGINLNTQKTSEPHDGMEFDSKEEAFSFYKDYAISVGFSTIIKASRKSRISGKFIDAKFVCTRYGTKREDSLSETPYPAMDTDGKTVVPVKRKRGRLSQSWLKTDCKACMHVKRRQQDGRWVVHDFVKEHNHEIFLDQAYYFHGRRNLDLSNNSVDRLHGIRGRTRKLFVSMSKQSDGCNKNRNQKSTASNQTGCSEYLALEEGDAQLMLEHFTNRERWIPVYMRDKFLAGMSSTQRSESVGCFFDKQLQRKSTLKEFLIQQKVILQEKFEDEAKADFETCHKQPGLKSPSPFGKQMANIYTHAIFKKFQIEVLGAVACHPRKECEDGETRTFTVQDFEGNRDYVVFWNKAASQFSCSCHSFEFNGYLCRHVLIVMQMSGVQSIPQQYILKRWTKDAKSRESPREESNKPDSRFQGYNDICRRALKLGDEGSLSQESYNIAFAALQAALRKCESVNSSAQYVIVPTSPSSSRPRQYEDTNHPDKTNRKDVSKNKQVQTEPEFITIGMHENWQQLGHSNLRALIHDCSYEMQESMQGMEQLNSRASNLDAYFGSQQIVGQLNSLAATRDDYYNNQHGLQRLGQLNPVLPVHDSHYLNQQRMQDMDQPTAASKHFHSKHLSR
ncbi:FAR1-related sequence 1 [Euphorbia peplus]|nr:FAR1-related sequence 1 [Euphorbia peplus]